jgi:hypothetical protein
MQIIKRSSHLANRHFGSFKAFSSQRLQPVSYISQGGAIGFILTVTLKRKTPSVTPSPTSRSKNQIRPNFGSECGE